VICGLRRMVSSTIPVHPCSNRIHSGYMPSAFQSDPLLGADVIGGSFELMPAVNAQSTVHICEFHDVYGSSVCRPTIDRMIQRCPTSLRSIERVGRIVGRRCNGTRLRFISLSIARVIDGIKKTRLSLALPIFEAPPRPRPDRLLQRRCCR